MNFSEETILKIIWIFFVSLIIIVICFAVTAVVAFKSKGLNFAKAYAKALVDLKILEIMLAIVMVFAASMLSVAKIISGDSAVTVISGITGYVLGGIRKNSSKYLNDDNEPEN